MSKLDAMIAPRALTVTELTSVITPHLIAYAVAHRAFGRAGTISDGSNHEVATVHACESALAGIVDDAMTSLNEWLSDMEGDRRPRFYRKASLKDVVEKLCRQAGHTATRQELPGSLETYLELLTDRDRGTTETLIALAGE